MRFAHIADTHLGYRQYNLDEREEDFYTAFNEAVDKIIAAGCDFVVHSGDLFDDPRPHVRAMVEVMRGLERLRDADIRVFAIAGNHDVLMRRGAVPPQRLYRSMDFLTPGKPWRVFDGVYICGLPYHSHIHSQPLKEKLRELAGEGADYEKKVLLLHQGIDKYFPLEYELEFNELPEGFDYYALGHVHKRITDTCGRGILAYSGSTEIWRADEIAEYDKNGKGFNIVDLDTCEVERVDITSVRPFIRAQINSEEDIRAVKGALGGGKRPVMRAIVRADFSEFRWLYKRIFDELGKEVLYLDIKREEPAAKAEDVSPGRLSLRELFEEAMEGHSKEEVEYALAVFELLSKGGQEEAAKVTEDFLDRWEGKVSGGEG